MWAMGGAGITHPGGSHAGGFAPRKPPGNGNGGGIVRGWGVWPLGVAGDEGGRWRREYPPGGSHAGGSAPRKPPGNGNGGGIVRG